MRLPGILRAHEDRYNVRASYPKAGHAEVAVYRTSSACCRRASYFADPFFRGLPALTSGAPEGVPISCLCASGSPLMAKRWYIIQALSNFESKVADAIREQAKHRRLDHLFEEIIVPTEKLLEVRHGQKHATERKFFPGYVLAKVELTDEAYHLIKNTP